MKVALITLESRSYGGGYYTIKEELPYFRKNDVEFSIICPKVEGVQSYLPGSIPIELDSMKGIDNPMDWSRRANILRELCKNAIPVIEEKLQPDVIISHSFFGGPLFERYESGPLRVFRDSSLMAAVEEVAERYGIRLPYKPYLEEWKDLEGRAIKKADVIMALCRENMDKMMESYKADPQKIFLTPRGINTKKFRRIETEKSGKPKLLYIGRCTPIKGIETLLVAMDILQKKGEEFSFDFAGQDPRKDYGGLVEELGLDIHYRGFVPHDKMPQTYSEGDLLLIPSLHESFGRVCLEGMGCGIPIIASNVGGLRDQLMGWDEQLVEPNNPNELAERVEEVLENDLGEEWSKREMERAKEYELSKIVSQKVGLWSDKLR